MSGSEKNNYVKILMHKLVILVVASPVWNFAYFSLMVLGVGRD